LRAERDPRDRSPPRARPGAVTRPIGDRSTWDRPRRPGGRPPARSSAGDGPPALPREVQDDRQQRDRQGGDERRGVVAQRVDREEREDDHRDPDRAARTIAGFAPVSARRRQPAVPTSTKTASAIALLTEAIADSRRG